MNRCLLLGALVALALSAPAFNAPLRATSVVPGCTVEIEQYFYSYYLGDDWWSLECRYRINDGEWRTAYREGSSDDRELRLPGTSVCARAVDYQVEWSSGEDVVSLRVGSRQIK